MSNTPLPSSRHDEETDWSLTRRETEVVRFLLAGAANKEIARVLGCSPRTIEVHVSSILRKSGVASRTELLAKFVARSTW